MDSTRPPPAGNPRRRHSRLRLRPWERMVPNPITVHPVGSPAPGIVHYSRGGCSDNRQWVHLATRRGAEPPGPATPQSHLPAIRRHALQWRAGCMPVAL
jgi:hypothetical protein